MFFSKRSFSALSSSSRCSGDNSFLLLFMLFISWLQAHGLESLHHQTRCTQVQFRIRPFTIQEFSERDAGILWFSVSLVDARRSVNVTNAERSLWSPRLDAAGPPPSNVRANSSYNSGAQMGPVTSSGL